MINYEAEGYFNIKQIPNHGSCANLQLLFTTAVVVGLDAIGYDRRYCFHTAIEAIKSLNEWDGTIEHPGGNWIKCKGSCHELRNPNYKENEKI
jgi:hypothetical protein